MKSTNLEMKSTNLEMKFTNLKMKFTNLEVAGGCVYQAPDVWHVIVGSVITLRPRQNGRHFADDIFKCIFINENVWFPIKFHWSSFLGVL